MGTRCCELSAPLLKLVGKMAKLFDEANRCISFIQVLALLASVCLASPHLQMSENRLRLQKRSSPEGNAVSIYCGLEQKKAQV